MEYNGSIETKQSRIKLTKRLLNSYGDKLVFLQTDYSTPNKQLSTKTAFTLKCFPGTPGFSEVHSEKSCIDSRRIGSPIYRRRNTISLAYKEFRFKGETIPQTTITVFKRLLSPK